MGKIKITDKHHAFAVEIAAGENQAKAYQKAFSSKASLPTAKVKASLLANNPDMKVLIEKAKETRGVAIRKANAKNLPDELKTLALDIEQLDSFHYAVVLNKVMIEEIYPVTTIKRNTKGVEISRTVRFERVKRLPNVKEKQASIDMIYKRFGSYAPSKFFGAVKNVGAPEGEEEDPTVERMIVLSNGDRIPLLK